MMSLSPPQAYQAWAQQMLGSVIMPRARFAAPNRLTAEAYADRANWLARPDISATNGSTWLPPELEPEEPGPAAVFYVHPTSYMAPFNVARWNASMQDDDSLELAQRFVRYQSSAFNGVGRIWAPRYHQAHFGAFLRRSEDSVRAIHAAYSDIAAAFDVFLAANPEAPIILAGHSQGSLLLLRLLKNRIAGTPVAQRIVAAYLAGWPVSLTEDIPALGLPACDGADQAGCIISWQSFAEPADTSAVTSAYGYYRGMTGRKRDDTPMLCVNPLTGLPDSEASAAHNLGTLIPAQEPGFGAGHFGAAGNLASITSANLAALVPPALKPGGGAPPVVHLAEARVGARCHQGFLLIGTSPPTIGPYVLPGNNYHVYDYALFWANIRADAERRLTTFLKNRSSRRTAWNFAKRFR